MTHSRTSLALIGLALGLALTAPACAAQQPADSLTGAADTLTATTAIADSSPVPTAPDAPPSDIPPGHDAPEPNDPTTATGEPDPGTASHAHEATATDEQATRPGPEEEPDPAPHSVEAARYLADHGVLTTENRVLIDGALTDGAAAMHTCEHLFGSVGGVLARTNLPADAQLHAVSGFTVTESGNAILCGYGYPDRPLLALQLSDWPDEWGPEGRPVVVTENGIQAVFSYVPDFEYDRIPDADAAAMLTEAQRWIAAAEDD